jgi:WD40 repeat protein
MNTPWAGAFLWTLALFQIGTVAGQEQARVRLKIQTGREAVISVAFLPDGRSVVTAGQFGLVRVWDIATGREIRRFGTPNFNGTLITADGRFAATADDAWIVRISDVATGREISSFQGDPGSSIPVVAFSPDGRALLTGGQDKIARLRDVASGREIRRFVGHSQAVTMVKFSPDGRSVLTGSYDYKTRFWDIRLWDVASGRETILFQGLRVAGVAFSPDSRSVLTSDSDGTLRLWDLASRSEVRRFEGKSNVYAIAFSADGRLVVTGSSDNTSPVDRIARLWDVASGREIRRFEGHSSLVISVAFSPDGRSVLTGSLDSTARLWDVGSGREIQRFEGRTEAVSAVAFSPDGHFVLDASYDNSVRLWDAASGREIRRFKVPQTSVGPGVNSVAFSPDGRSVLTGGLEFTARLWDIASGREIRRFEGYYPQEPIRPSPTPPPRTFSPDGRLILTGGACTQVWDAASGREIRRFDGVSSGGVAFSPDGRSILTAGDGLMQIWDLATGREIRRFEGDLESISSVAFSPDGLKVFTGCGLTCKTARLWDVASGREIRHFEMPSLGIQSVGSVGFSPDGRSVLARDANGSAHLWDVTSGLEIRRFETGRFSSAVFSPNGKLVLTGTFDGSWSLWDVASGRLLATHVSFDDGSWAVVDPEGRYDASDPDNSPGLHWVVDEKKIVLLGQLKNRFYTPGLLGRAIAGERLPAVRELQSIPLAPEVEANQLVPNARELVVRLNNQGGGIGRVAVKVNGRLLPGGSRGERPDPQAASALVRIPLDGVTRTIDGNNVIEVAAYDASGMVASRGVTVTWKTDQQQAKPPVLYAIVAGSNQYANPAMKLTYAAKDAADMAQAIRIAAVGMLNDPERVSIRLLTTEVASDSVPNKRNLKKAFEEVASKAHSGDILLVYFAGHGLASNSSGEEEYYYLTSEARSLEIERDAALRDLSAVSSSELKQWLAAPGMPLKQVVILDTCAAGAASQRLTEKRELSPDQIRAIEFLKDATGSHILMGSAAGAASYEAASYGQGVLTYALLRYMRQGQLPDDGSLDVVNWFNVAERDVPDLARGIGGVQKPTVSRPTGSTTFPIGILRVPDRGKIPLAQMKYQVLQAQCLDQNDLDGAELAGRLRPMLREASRPVTRGSPRSEPALVYIDTVAGDVPGALIPQIRYTKTGNRISAQVRLNRDGKRVSQASVDTTLQDAGEAILRSLIAQIESLPRPEMAK